ncbi:MAG: ATP-binding protein [Candidatus Desulforudis sp.]|nr:ATP-binding protein [Desulforudis sp.]
MLSLGSLNVLIGPNAAGKTNLIEVISLLQALPRDLYRNTRRSLLNGCANRLKIRCGMYRRKTRCVIAAPQPVLDPIPPRPCAPQTWVARRVTASGAVRA